MDIRRNLTSELRELTQQSYMLALATVSLLERDNSDIVTSLPEAVNQLCSDGRVVPDNAVEMTPKEVKRLKVSFASFTIDLLLVKLHALFHTHLMLAAGYKLDQPAVQMEALLASLWPKEKRGDSEWACREAILLTEIRNAVMHARGQVDKRSKRLLDAGWSIKDLEDEPRLARRTFSDFLRFKRAVRTIANEVL